LFFEAVECEELFKFLHVDAPQHEVEYIINNAPKEEVAIFFGVLCVRRRRHYVFESVHDSVVLNLFHCWDPLNATDVVWDTQVKIEKVCAPE